MNWADEAQLVGRVLLAALLGGLVGLQREHIGRQAGVRTYAAVSVGSCMFGLISLALSGDTRIASGVVTGVGFLCAGVILREEGHIIGLTTAATLWATASVGLAIAYGRFVLGSLVAVILLILLAIPLKKWERRRDLRDDQQ